MTDVLHLAFRPEQRARIAHLFSGLRPLFPADALGKRRGAIGSGIKVLDLGCGVLDVSVLVARMVGESGAVLGIDRTARCASRYKQRGE